MIKPCYTTLTDTLTTQSPSNLTLLRSNIYSRLTYALAHPLNPHIYSLKLNSKRTEQSTLKLPKCFGHLNLCSFMVSIMPSSHEFLHCVVFVTPNLSVSYWYHLFSKKLFFRKSLTSSHYKSLSI